MTRAIVAAAAVVVVSLCGPAASADTLPRCVYEDCSDQPGQIGVWISPDTGEAWISTGEQSYRAPEL